MGIRVVVPPAVEPVTTAEALLWCRAGDDDAPLVARLIQAARERAEHETQRIFVQRTLEWSGSGFYPMHNNARFGYGYGIGPQIALAAPMESIESISYLDLDGVEQALPVESYELDAACEPGVLRYMPGVTLPPVMQGRADAVRIRFVAGYPVDLTNPATPDYRKNLPAALLVWMQVQVSTWYTQRESLATTLLSEPSRNYIGGLLDGLILASRFA